MTFNAYITLDGYKYATLQKDWEALYETDRAVRRTTLGVADVTFSDADFEGWEGTIITKASPPTGYGSYTDLLTSLKKKSKLSYTDHFGTTVNVVALGPFKQRGTLPNWDQGTMHVKVRLVKA